MENQIIVQIQEYRLLQRSILTAKTKNDPNLPALKEQYKAKRISISKDVDKEHLGVLLDTNKHIFSEIFFKFKELCSYESSFEFGYTACLGKMINLQTELDDLLRKVIKTDDKKPQKTLF